MQSMEELLKHLERQIKTLINQQDQIQDSNQSLHQSKLGLSREKDLLKEKQQQAISRIETLLVRLKALEKCS